ncbi:MAG: glycosyltransferase [Thermoplasmata archaeon]
MADSPPTPLMPLTSSGPSVLVTLPVYNEAPRIRDSVERLLRVLEESGLRFRLSIAEDGSTDGSREIIRELVGLHPDILVQSDPERHGRGWALRQLWSRIDADFYSFSDTDFAADPRFLVEGIRIAQGGKPVVSGSRYVPGATVTRPPIRRTVSKWYNWLVRRIFREHIQDHQCGLKVFSREAVRTLLPRARENSWFWDTEMLVLATSMGLEVTEFPVDWVEHKLKRTSMLRLASDVYLHGTGMLRLVGYCRGPSNGHSVRIVPIEHSIAPDEPPRVVEIHS